MKHLSVDRADLQSVAKAGYWRVKSPWGCCGNMKNMSKISGSLSADDFGLRGHWNSLGWSAGFQTGWFRTRRSTSKGSVTSTDTVFETWDLIQFTIDLSFEEMLVKDVSEEIGIQSQTRDLGMDMTQRCVFTFVQMSRVMDVAVFTTDVEQMNTYIVHRFFQVWDVRLRALFEWINIVDLCTCHDNVTREVDIGNEAEETNNNIRDADYLTDDTTIREVALDNASLYYDVFSNLERTLIRSW